MKPLHTRWLAVVPLKTVLIAVLFLLSVLLFSFLAHIVLQAHEDLFDQEVHAFFLHHATVGVIGFMQRLTFLGSARFLLPAYLVLITCFLLRKKFRYGIAIAVIALSSFLSMQGLKLLFHRKRPELPVIREINSYSFPSGHSLSAFIFCTILSYLIWKGRLQNRWKVLLITSLFLLAVLIGLSRIVLNVHYATDVIAGFCLGVMWVILSFWILRKRMTGSGGS